MSRKIKPVFEDAPANNQTDAVQNEQLAEECNSAACSIGAKDEPMIQVGPKSFTKEMAQKLEQFDAIVAQNSTLLKERDMLTEKITEYITEIQKLKSVASDQSNDCKQDDKIVALQREKADLQKAYDALLMKVSDLNFENAKLTCQVQELAKNSSATVQQNLAKARRPIAQVDPYNPYVSNGYSQWN